ncbi:hypothetical protein G8759_30545 [Spirosoma aureum]|uniref:DUF2188 domain-containing protein n=1 Tax=Spirosoma aureum TaxID=2692134 RepID=A0A6G9AWD0_9BACT|nr:hypothetical protein [Spirosoma aureum]QIP16674.1 hypothetical protein G8759_30545 [Spirosoma aureum]
MWTPTHFPAAMRSLNPSTRAKAIEIANRLLEQGALDKQRIVALSVDEARRLARLVQSEPITKGWQPHV